MKRDSAEWKTNFRKLLKLEKEVGFDLLLNESRVVSNKNKKFNIIGVENLKFFSIIKLVDLIIGDTGNLQ